MFADNMQGGSERMENTEKEQTHFCQPQHGDTEAEWRTKLSGSQQ